jgi:hypothetical protein
MLLIRHAVLHPDGLRHVNLQAQPGSKAGRQWFHNFRQYRVLAGRHLPVDLDDQREPEQNATRRSAVLVQSDSPDRLFHRADQYHESYHMKPIAHAYVSRRIEYWTCHYLMEWG